MVSAGPSPPDSLSEQYLAGGQTYSTAAVERRRMGSLGKHTVNGIVSLAISVAVTVAAADDGDEYDLTDVALAVAVSAFLSGFFTSYFAK